MQLSWSFRRKLVYSGVTLVIALALTTYVWLTFFHAAPTCFDNKQNGNETGVDCGGSCALVCQNASRPPIVEWARVFPNGGGSMYTAAAYVQNTNGNEAAHSARYVFQFYDANNHLITEKDGVADLPPVEVVPIVTQVDVGNATVAHVQFSFDDTYPLVWNIVPAANIPNLRTSTQQLSANGSRLDATIENNSIFDATNVKAVAILFDSSGTALAASQSVIPAITHKSSTNVVFTWPTSNQNIARTEIIILPSF